LRELCKYIVDGNQLASWSAEDIAAYVHALKNQRTFGVFGVLYRMRQEHRKFLDEVQADKHACPCGCTAFRFFSEEEWEWFECVNGSPDPSQNVARTPRTTTTFSAEQSSLL